MGFLNWWRNNVPGAKTTGDLFAAPKPESEGLPGYDQMQQQMDSQMGTLGPQYQEQFDEYLKGLQDMAAGRGESLAEQQFKAASGQAQQQIAMQGASGRGNVGQAQRMVTQAQGQVGQGLAQGSAMARLQEQMAAKQQLGQAIMQGDQSTLAHQQQWLQYMQAKMGLSAEEAQNLLGYFQSQVGQPTTGDKIMNFGSTIAGMMGAAGGGGGGGAPSIPWQGPPGGSGR